MIRPGNRGFTLVEIIVASVVLALSVLATVSMVRKAQEISVLDEHCRKARGIINGLFESPTYQQMNYFSLNPNNRSPDTTFSKIVTLDSASTTSRIRANVQTKISCIQNTLGVNGPFKRVTITVAWKEFGVTGTAPADSEKVSIEKWVSP